MNVINFDWIQYQKLKVIKYNTLNNFVKYVTYNLEKYRVGEIGTIYIEGIFKRIQTSNQIDVIKSPLEQHHYFSIDIYPTDKNREWYYYLYWDIRKAQKLISDYNLQPKKIYLDEISGMTEEGKLVKSRLDFARNNHEPIILVRNEIYGTYIPIDGNHRIFVNRFNKKVNAYILNVEQSFECMAGDIFKDLYKLEHNIKIINNELYRCLNNKGKFKLNRREIAELKEKISEMCYL